MVKLFAIDGNIFNENIESPLPRMSTGELVFCCTYLCFYVNGEKKNIIKE